MAGCDAIGSYEGKSAKDWAEAYNTLKSTSESMNESLQSQIDQLKTDKYNLQSKLTTTQLQMTQSQDNLEKLQKQNNDRQQNDFSYRICVQNARSQNQDPTNLCSYYLQ